MLSWVNPYEMLCFSSFLMQNISVLDSVLGIGIAIAIMILGEGVGKGVDAESSGIR